MGEGASIHEICIFLGVICADSDQNQKAFINRTYNFSIDANAAAQNPLDDGPHLIFTVMTVRQRIKLDYAFFRFFIGPINEYWFQSMSLIFLWSGPLIKNVFDFSLALQVFNLRHKNFFWPTSKNL